jgi:hypothetical protein
MKYNKRELLKDLCDMDVTELLAEIKRANLFYEEIVSTSLKMKFR